MGENTEIRREEDARQQGFFGRNLSKLVVAAMTAGVGGAGTYGLDLVNDLKDELAVIRQDLALQNQEMANLRQEQMEHIWRRLYLQNERLEENSIQLGSLERFIALAMSEGDLTNGDAQALLESLRVLADPEYGMDFTPQQVEQFRGIQEKHSFPAMKK